MVEDFNKGSVAPFYDEVKRASYSKEACLAIVFEDLKISRNVLSCAGESSGGDTQAIYDLAQDRQQWKHFVQAIANDISNNDNI
eukprot:2216909-Amphidinium_carterae.1